MEIKRNEIVNLFEEKVRFHSLNYYNPNAKCMATTLMNKALLSVAQHYDVRVVAIERILHEEVLQKWLIARKTYAEARRNISQHSQ